MADLIGFVLFILLIVVALAGRRFLRGMLGLPPGRAMRRCPVCGAYNLVSASHCNECNTPLEAGAPTITGRPTIGVPRVRKDDMTVITSTDISVTDASGRTRQYPSWDRVPEETRRDLERSGAWPQEMRQAEEPAPKPPPSREKKPPESDKKKEEESRWDHLEL